MMVDHLDDGKVDFFERVQNAWMKITAATIADGREIRSTSST